MSTNATVSSPATVEATTSTPGTAFSSPPPSSASPPISGADSSSTPSPASSTPTQPTTTNVPTTSTTPTTPIPATTTTPPESSAAQTSAAAVTTTPSSQASSTSSTSTAALITTTTSSFTTQVATTVPSTDPAGSVVYVTTSIPDVVATAITSSIPSASSGTSSNTGVIVGAVVGGVAGIAIIALLIFCIRRRVRKDEFDGNFDPDRVVGHTDTRGGTLPHVDLAEEVNPFPQSYTNQGSSSMRQYGDSKYLAVSSSPAAGGQASTEFYTPGAGASTDAQSRPFMSPGAGPPPSGAYLPPTNMYGTGPVDWHTPHPGVSPPPSTVSNNTTSTRAAKEREALERSGQASRVGLATQQEAAEGSGDVVVHQDAGRAPVEEHVPPREIPPAYESIPQD